MNTAAGVGSSLGYRSVLDFFGPFCIKTKGRCPPGIEGKSNDCLSALWPRGLVLFLDKKDQKSSAFRRYLGAQSTARLAISARAASCCLWSLVLYFRKPANALSLHWPADGSAFPALTEYTGLRRKVPNDL